MDRLVYSPTVSTFWPIRNRRFTSALSEFEFDLHCTICMKYLRHDSCFPNYLTNVSPSIVKYSPLIGLQTS